MNLVEKAQSLRLYNIVTLWVVCRPVTVVGVNNSGLAMCTSIFAPAYLMSDLAGETLYETLTWSSSVSRTSVYGEYPWNF